MNRQSTGICRYNRVVSDRCFKAGCNLAFDIHALNHGLDHPVSFPNPIEIFVEVSEPDSIDLDRQKAGQQLAFSAGVHFCIGAPLARQELNLGFMALMNEMSNIRLDEDKPAPEAEISFILRNLPSLHLRYDPVS